MSRRPLSHDERHFFIGHVLPTGSTLFGYTEDGTPIWNEPVGDVHALCCRSCRDTQALAAALEAAATAWDNALNVLYAAESGERDPDDAINRALKHLAAAAGLVEQRSSG